MRISDWSSDVCSSDLHLEQVDLVVAVHVLQDRGQALQAHAGVHAGRGKRQQAAVGLAVELHEHQVPDFDETVAVLVGRTRWAAGDMRAVVVEDLGARAAGTGVGHLPEVVRSVRRALRSEEHTSELQSLMRISYAVFCLKKKKSTTDHNNSQSQ